MTDPRIEKLRADGKGNFLCPSCGVPASDNQPYPYCVMGCTEKKILTALSISPLGECPEFEAKGRLHNQRTCPSCQERFEWARIEGRERAEARRASALAGSWDLRTGEEYDPSEPEPSPRVLAFGEGRYAFAPGVQILYGGRGSGKTWIAYEAVRQEAAEGYRALILDYEMSHSEAMGRLHRDLGTDLGTLARVDYVHSPPALMGAERLLSQYPEPPSVVVLDSIGRSMGAANLDHIGEKDVYRWASALPLMLKEAWPDTVILLIDHITKSALESGGATDPVGSGAKGNMADGLYQVQRLARFSRSVSGSGRLLVRKDRRGWAEDDGSALLDFTFGGGEPFTLSGPDPDIVTVDLSAQPSTDDEVLADLVAAGSAGIGKTELCGRGDAGQYRRAALGRLVEDGKAIERKVGRTTMCWAAEFAPEE